MKSVNTDWNLNAIRLGERELMISDIFETILLNVCVSFSNVKLPVV